MKLRKGSTELNSDGINWDKHTTTISILHKQRSEQLYMHRHWYNYPNLYLVTHKESLTHHQQ